MKTLVIVAHPDLANSRVNKAWAEALSKQPDVTVRDLTALYPDMNIDILEEQIVLQEHQRVVLQFPLYWYSSPAILKQWLDLVLQPGFAYAYGGDKLKGQEWMVSTSVGGPMDGYGAGRYANFSVDEFLRPFQQTAAYIGATYLAPHCFYRSVIADDEEVAASTQAMLRCVLKRDIDNLRDHEEFVNASMDALFSRHAELAA